MKDDAQLGFMTSPECALALDLDQGEADATDAEWEMLRKGLVPPERAVVVHGRPLRFFGSAIGRYT